MELIFTLVLQIVPNPWRYMHSICLLPMYYDSYSYSFGNGDCRCAESTLGPLPPRNLMFGWEIISCRKQERELICKYEYMLNFFQCGVEIYKCHLQMKAKFH